ncbi:MAG: PAS domain S-box protein [Melioribacteraceae bacterium]|nr:PAS domain S-box protein [Melioribacteraceae bacterium]
MNLQRIFERESFLQNFLDSLNECILVINTEGQIEYSNEIAETYFQYTKNELLKKDVHILIPDRFHENHKLWAINYIKNPRSRPMGQGQTLFGKKRDGAEFPVEISLSTITFENKPYIVTYITDITKRKKLEDDLIERNKDLDSFAHMVAHDLNTSITNLIGFSHLILEDEYSRDEILHFVRQIKRNGIKMASVVKELLMFADLNKSEVILRETDMLEVVKSAIDRNTEAIEEKKAQIILPEEFFTALSYAPWIEEVWYNLLSNAVKYGGEPPLIEFGSTDLGNKIKFWIKDNGIGLSDEQKQIVFSEPDKVFHPLKKGSSLGLYIVQRIIYKLNGSVGVNSKLNEGSEFYFILGKN